MFISKMNRLFHKHGRLAFGLLTLFIIVPFVLYFSVAPEEIMNMFSFGSKKSNISINGSRIPQKEFDDSMSSLMVSMSIQGWPVDFNSSSTYQQLTPEAVDRIILMDEVKRLKITADDAALTNYLKQQPMFQEANGFSYDRYKMVCYALSRYGISQKQIESTLREEASIGILKRMIANSVVVTDNGALDFYNNLNQSFSIKVAEFNAKDYLSKVTVDDNALKVYFESNSGNYMTPEKSKAYIAKFDYAFFKDEAQKSITDDQVNKIYETSKANFPSLSEKDGKDKVRDQLIEQYCSNATKTKAQEFAVNAYKAIEQDGKISGNSKELFENLALKNKVDLIKTTSWISADSDLIENIGKEPALVSQISAVYPDQPVSNAVEGKKAYFVALLTDRIDSKKASFDEVKKKVTDDFKMAQAIKLAQEDAAKFRETALKADKSKLASDKKFTKSLTFSQSDFASIMADPNARDIVELTTKTAQGQISNVANNSDGAIIVFVEKISLPSKEDFNKNKDSIENQYKMALEQIAWMNYNLMLKNKANALIYESSQR